LRLVLFDIDGTLIDSGGAGIRSLNLAFEEYFSVKDAFTGMNLAGKTDIQILREALARHSMDDHDRNIAVLCVSYISHLREQIENPGRHLKPGIMEAIEILCTMDATYLGLLTGNIEEGARIKLDPFGLNRYFPVGAFGNDHEDRNMLLPVAIERFRVHSGMRISKRECIVIGDTPRDVDCAKIHGALSIAVATGPYSYESLALSGADAVLRDMSEMDYSFIRNFVREPSVQDR
jgi:phosphoglycolate phosphatase-like HAD superfamily hydrolase